MAKPRFPKRALWLFVIAGSLFIPAGTIAWPQGWIFFFEFVGGVLVMAFWLKRRDPALFEERVHNPGRASQARWDKVFVVVKGVAWYAWIIVMAFDRRWGWSPLPVYLSVVGALLIPTGYLLTARAMKANSFAATVVRLQEERGQRVADTGPYAVVRHPIYTASVFIHIGTALLLGSLIGLEIVPVLVILLMVRAVLEERLLRQGLPGYAEYMAKVRWRLLPGLW